MKIPSFAGLLPILLLAVGWPALAAQTSRDVGVYARDAELPAGRRLAVVVGVDSYESRALTPLSFAERDAFDVATELTAMGYLVTRMRVNGESDEPKPLSAESITRQVRTMCRLAEPDGVLLFYFSGHGFEASDGRTFLCPYDADPAKLQSTGLDLGQVRDLLADSGVSRRLLIVDMCRRVVDKSIDEREFTLRQFARAEGTGLLFSTAPGTVSWEPVLGMKDERGAAIENGLFTHYLLRGLRGEADRGRRGRHDGFLTFREVAHFVSDGLAALTMTRRDFEQVPYMKWDGTAEDVLLRIVPVEAAEPPRPVEPPAPTPSERQPRRGDRLELADELVMLYVEPGRFRMGSPEGEEGRFDDERLHDVTLTKGFWLAETEVTQRQWQQVMGTTPWKGESAVLEDPHAAASCITWDEAVAFCAALTERERKAGRLPRGFVYRLPTEAEWEYACRAGSTTPFCFGASESELGRYAVFGDSQEGSYAHPVKGERRANAWGFYDMHGNVWEWCLDAFGSETYDGPAVDPVGVGGSMRVIRGGSWSGTPRYCRSAYRFGVVPARRSVDLGFRPALALSSDG